MLDDLCNLLGALGKPIKLAFADVKDKASTLKKNKAFMVNEFNKPEGVSIQDAILTEIDLKVIKCNGENNHKILPKSKKDTWEWTYVSTGRHLVRMWWFTDCLSRVFNAFVTDENIHPFNVIKDAYDASFAAHHPWIIRKGAHLGMRASPSREVVFTSCHVLWKSIA